MWLFLNYVRSQNTCSAFRSLFGLIGPARSAAVWEGWGEAGGAVLLVPLAGSPGLCCTVILGKLEMQSVSFSVERSTTTVDDHVAELTWPWLNKGIIQSEESDPVTD